MNKKLLGTSLLFTSLLALLTGCYSVKFLPYSGEQQSWPTATGSFTAPKMPLPVYYGYPPKPYTYIGQIEVVARHPSVDVILVAAQQAKEHGADALLVIEDTERPIGSTGVGNGYAVGTSPNTAFGFGSSYSAVQYGGQTKAIAIKWK